MPVAKFRNKKFTAKAIRNDLMLYQSTTFSNTPDKNLQAVAKLLNEMEKKWSAEQKQLHKLKILEKLDKAKNQAEYTLKLLRLCKTWNGPATSVEELHEILRSNSEKAEKIMRTELSYYRDTHKSLHLSPKEMSIIST